LNIFQSCSDLFSVCPEQRREIVENNYQVLQLFVKFLKIRNTFIHAGISAGGTK
jgi:hypothetical protein